MCPAQKCKPFQKRHPLSVWTAACFVASAVLISLTAGLIGIDNYAVISSVRTKPAQVLIASDSSPQQEWKVMTYNIRHARGTDNKISLRRIAQVIRQEEANVVALQEVDRYMWRSGFQDQVKQLAQLLGMNWAFAPSMKIGNFAYGNAILSHDPIQSATSVSLGGMWENRTMLQATISTNRGWIDVYTTHLGLSEEERVQQMPHVLRFLEQAKEPALWLGDFNMEASHPLLHMPERWKKLEQSEQRGTIMGKREIDHIYAAQPGGNVWEVQEVYVPVSIASDHLPVVANLRWTTAAD